MPSDFKQLAEAQREATRVLRTLTAQVRRQDGLLNLATAPVADFPQRSRTEGGQRFADTRATFGPTPFRIRVTPSGTEERKSVGGELGRLIAGIQSSERGDRTRDRSVLTEVTRTIGGTPASNGGDRSSGP